MIDKRLSHVIAACAAFFIMIGAIIGITTAQEEQPVFRIGVIDDERGSITNGVAFAAREINREGGVRGADGTFFRLELVVAPPTDAGDISAAVDQLREAEVIAVFGPQTTEAVLSGLPLLQQLGVPVLTPAIGDTVLATDNSGLLFRIRAAERLQGRALASLLVEELNVNQVTTVQLDRASTGGRVGFSIALNGLAPTIDENTILLDTSLTELITQLAVAQPPTIVAFGEPQQTAEFYNGLRNAGWAGVFAYPQADEPGFSENIPLDDLIGVLGTTTWPVTAVDDASVRFITSFVRTFGQAPDAIAASAYDGVILISEAIGQPGTLRQNLVTTRSIPGVQGLLNPTGLVDRELSNAVAVVQMNAVGGPAVAARYAGTTRLEPDQPAQVGGTPVPTITPTPEGVVITIESARQNVRSGPGTEYDVLGQLQQGEQRRVIGANIDFTWVVVEFRGQNGWLYVPIADIFGDRNTVSIVAAPPTPTPPPATNTPTPPPLPDLVITAANPNTITIGVLTNINVTVRNQGGASAGQFAIAATFPPDSLYSAVTVNELAAGAEQIVALPVTLSGATGNFNVVIVADLNNQVNEGPGEANNDDFTFNYKVDRQLILINSTTLGIGTQLDLEGNVTPQYDLTYTASGLNTTAACSGTTHCIGIISPGFTFDTAHYNAIGSATGVSDSSIPNSSLQAGTIIGILTAEGRRGVIRVDAIQPGISITLTYRVYSNP